LIFPAAFVAAFLQQFLRDGFLAGLQPSNRLDGADLFIQILVRKLFSGSP